ncbi:hypothetical protein [Undibacterium fentianense]|uniref:Uncharacterized protein n=1 Tax=Undibacterium fentianense TaxID=2828728 RepID=A0A941E241_9BURK|nr:hypothetical protein [Undibacterium fentianense]MBR7799837.1 hypothetical protein [Undibacterium fentianense]
MTYFTRSFTTIVALLILPTVSQSQTERVLPTLDEQLVRPLLVVADLVPGTYFARPAKSATCSQPSVVCIDFDPPPFSLTATVNLTVYGGEVPQKLEVITSDHFGMRGYEKGLNSVLVMLKTDGQIFTMPRYAKSKLIRSKKNDLYMLVFGSDPTLWLPCSVSDLKGEISSDDFETSIEIPEDQFGAYRVEKFPEYFHRTATGAIPRYAIAISKLNVHLNSLKPVNEQMSCSKEQRARH